jgi:Na+-translocating ferredoxin:NAD+ oxidoreductase RNF subunit RnfB
MVVPQFWQAGIALVELAPSVELVAALLPFAISLDCGFEAECACARANFAVFETRLLNAGHPLQPR